VGVPLDDSGMNDEELDDRLYHSAERGFSHQERARAQVKGWAYPRFNYNIHLQAANASYDNHDRADSSYKESLLFTKDRQTANWQLGLINKKYVVCPLPDMRVFRAADLCTVSKLIAIIVCFTTKSII
jgi:hypothetical protein